jgi:Permuted papain-like amidase enzyme, YaeF/YiiX, C92 family
MKNKDPLLTKAEREQLQSGDLVFISVRSPFYRQVAATCGSWDGSFVVAESRVPVSSYTTLDRFLARSDAGRFCIRRLQGGLTPEQTQRLRDEADRRMGKIYHLGFDFDSNRAFCSKLVYESFRDALGLEVGRLETFHELFQRNPSAPTGFWQLWFFGFIPWQRRTVTTTSQLQSPHLLTILAAGI